METTQAVGEIVREVINEINPFTKIVNMIETLIKGLIEGYSAFPLWVSIPLGACLVSLVAYCIGQKMYNTIKNNKKTTQTKE